MFSKIKSYTSKKPLVSIIVLNTVVMLVCLFVLNFHFETNDDNAFVAFFGGYYGMRDYHVIFMNSLLGRIQVFLFEAIPGFNWYTFMLVVLVYTSFNVIGYVLVMLRDSIRAVLPYGVALLCVLAPCFYTVLQFSRVASICLVAGFLLLLVTFERGKADAGKIVAAGVMILLGSMLRFDMVFSIGLIFVPAYVVVIVRAIRSKGLSGADGEKKSGGDGRKVVGFIVSCAVIGAVCILTYFLDKASYSAEEYKNWTTFNTERGELMDFDWPDYEANKDVYQGLGISENSFVNFSGWDFDDPNFINIESMKSIIDAKSYSVHSINSISSINFGDVARYWLWVLSSFYTYAFFPLLIAGVVIGLVYAGFKQDRIVVVLTVLAFLLAEFIFAYLKRGMIERVDAGVFTAVILLCICFARVGESDFAGRETDSGEKKAFSIKDKLVGAVFAVCVLAFCVGFYVDQRDVRVSQQGGATLQVLLDKAANDKEHTYIMPTSETVVPISFEMWRTEDFGYEDNLINLGGWRTASPVKENQKKLRGIDNLYADMVDRDDVLFLIKDSSLDVKLQYLKENYCPDVMAVQMKRLYGAGVYRFVSESRGYPDEAYLQGFEPIDSSVNFEYELIDSEESEGKTLLGTLIADSYGDSGNGGAASFKQEVILMLADEDGNERYYPTVQIVNDDYADGDAERYTKFVCELSEYEARLLGDGGTILLLK